MNTEESGVMGKSFTNTQDDRTRPNTEMGHRHPPPKPYLGVRYQSVGRNNSNNTTSITLDKVVPFQHHNIVKSFDNETENVSSQ